MRLALPLASLLLLTALAGCSQTAPVSSDEDLDFDELNLSASATTGILRGVVIDTAIRPVAAVEILLTGTDVNRTTTTNDQGLFGFGDLPEGDYFVVARKPGYSSTQSSGKVVAGIEEPPLVKIQIAADPATRPFVQPYHLDGFMTCSLRAMIVAYPCGFGSDDIVNDAYELERRPDWIQLEMVWDSTQAIGDEMSLSIRCLPDEDPAELCQSGQQGIVRSEGISPQIATINRTVADTWLLGGPGGNPLSVWIYAFGRSDLDVYDEETIDPAQEPVTGKPCLEWQDQGLLFGPGTCMRATGPGLILNQKVDVYTHVYYGFLPPEGWSFGEHGEAKPPT